MYRVFCDVGSVKKVELKEVLDLLDLPSDFPVDGLVLEGMQKRVWMLLDGDEIIAIVFREGE